MSDDHDILALIIPAGTLARAGPGHFVLRSPLGPVVNASLTLGRAAVLDLMTRPADLPGAEPVDHMVTVALGAGTFRIADTRLWVLRDGRLAAGGR